MFDPQDTRELIVDYPGYDSWKDREMVITEKTGKRPSLPEKMTKKPAGSSRLLQGAKKVNADRKASAVTPSVPAVSFRNIGKGGAEHV